MLRVCLQVSCGAPPRPTALDPPLNTYVHAIHVQLLLSQSPRKIIYVSFSLDHALRSISSAKLRDFFRHPTVIVPMKPSGSDAFVLVCSNTVLKTDGGAHLANCDSCLKPFKCVGPIGHERTCAFVIRGIKLH